MNTRADTRADTCADTRVDTRADTCADTRVDTRAHTCTDSSAENPSETRAETLAETCADNRTETRTDKRVIIKSKELFQANLYETFSEDMSTDIVENCPKVSIV